ncbi:MAG: hypothetical protein AB1726_12650 [Planctomycetota bacterium]
MSPIPCEEFRDRLERALRGRPARPGSSPLAWHEHLLGCGACRALLAAEEALEELLGSLPEPQLPPHLAIRVLARLADSRAGESERDLDRLLDLDRAPAAPADLAPRVLAGLAAARRAEREEERLDRLLDRVPAPPVPPALAGRLLAALAAEREAARRPGRLLRFLARPPARRLAAAAVLVGLGLVAWRLVLGTPGRSGPGPADDPGREAELIAWLDVLEPWELLMSNDLDLTLAGIDPVDVTLAEAAIGEVDAASPPDGEAPAGKEKEG